MQADRTSLFPVALNLSKRSVLVIGGADEAVEKVPKLIAAGAAVKIVSPEVDASLARLARTRAVSWYARAFAEQDVQGVHLVMLTERDEALAARLRGLGGFWLCAIDQPAFSDIYLVSVVRTGPLLVSISSSGEAPLLARRIRQGLERAFDARFGEFARKFARLRAELRALPKAERIARLTRALDGFAMDVRVSYPDEAGLGAGGPSDEARGHDLHTPRD
ncbi:MAG TPA: bifunctional precorrin-2 dehydrogenase/sirohydrochlorin ferrochelatase [Polyangiales bacterium]